ncbi:Rha family transcriptional regulator [Weissella cibaria]|uniref:Rha family transcriptional regulator n=1 Tax=Weissella cibaria TaxID=137591 RepID=UPI000705CBB1|nr:Rha family transcriptional regulator [Weissella cibaria]ALI33921.1 hypothetical protein AO080_10925 [Weissella cibaria]
MDKLVMYANPKDGIYTTSEIIAKYTGVSIEHVGQLTRKHTADLEKFGKLVFENRALPSGQKRKLWHYNEEQATLLITFMRNTQPVVEFKIALVAAFFSQKEEIAHKQALLNDLTKVNKSLADVIKDRFPEWAHAYSSINNLALKKVTGLDARHLKDKFNVGDAKDALTAEQVEQLEKVREAIKSLLLIGFDYNQLKATMAA